MAIYSLPWCLPPSLLFSITLSSFLAFIYVPFFTIIFLNRKINMLPFLALRNRWESKYLEKVWSCIFFSPTQMHTPFFFFAWFSYYMCVFLGTLFLIIHSCHVTKRNYWVLDWLMAGAYYWHKTSALAIALAASKLLLSEELAALPSLARPLHRLVKDGCWGWGYSSGWQGHSGSVVGFRFRHTHTHLPLFLQRDLAPAYRKARD